MTTTDTIVVGLDGGEWSIIDYLISEGRMPNTESLIDNGCSADLHTTMPPVSPLAWNSIYTGVNPGKHGVFDFSSFGEDYCRRSISSNDRKATPFWEMLNDNDISTGLFKLPFTYPVSEVAGFFISGFPTPSAGSEAVYPKEIQETIGDPADLFEDSSLISEGKLEQLRDNLYGIIARQTDTLLSCLENHDPEFVMTVYDGSDRIQHFFWKYMDPSHCRYTSSQFQNAIYEYYELFDRELGKILESASENTNIILISDHGFGPLENDINIESWLSNNGYLTWKDESRESAQRRSVTGRTLWTLWTTVKQIGAEKHVKSIIPENVYKFGKQLSIPKKANYEWETTSAFFSTVSGQSIYINLESRFQNGSVADEEYNELVNKLVSELRSLNHPETEESLFETVVRADEVYNGWAMSNAPDIILNAADRYAITGGPDQDFLSQSTQHGRDRSGDHRKSGIFVGNGPAFQNDNSQRLSFTVVDILPLLLFVNDAPVPNHVDGSLPRSVISGNLLESRSISKTNNYGKSTGSEHKWDENEARELEENLKDLGYLE